MSRIDIGTFNYLSPKGRGKRSKDSWSPYKAEVIAMAKELPYDMTLAIILHVKCLTAWKYDAFWPRVIKIHWAVNICNKITSWFKRVTPWNLSFWTFFSKWLAHLTKQRTCFITKSIVGSCFRILWISKKSGEAIHHKS